MTFKVKDGIAVAGTAFVDGSRNVTAGTISGSNATLTGELRGPATFVIDPAAVGDNTGTVVIKGDLQVDGVTTTVNSTTLTVDDKNLELGSVASPSNTTADGGGITLKGATDKTFNWINSTGSWTSSENIALVAGKNILLNGSISGTITLASAATAGTNTITLPAVTGTIITSGDTGTVTNAMLAGSIANSKLVNSSTTIGTTAIALGASSTTLAGLTSVTSTSFVGALTGNASTATQLVATVAGTTSIELVRGNMGDNDQARILVGATATNAGFLEIATADDGTEPIHVRQYSGAFASLTRTATLLDGSGNTSFPGTVTAPTFIGALTGNASTATTLQTTRSIALSGAATGTATNFNGSANITIPVTGLNATNLDAGIVPDARITGTYTNFTHRLDGSNTVFTLPSPGSTNTAARTVYGLAEYRSDAGAQVGAIVFTAPTAVYNIMHQLEVQGMLYTQNIFRMTVQGYSYLNAATAWVDARKISFGTVDIQTRWAYTPTGLPCLILGDVGTTWSYPHVSIVRALFSHSGTTDTYCTGWSVAVVTSLTGYTQLTATIPDSVLTGSISGNAVTVGGLSVHTGTNNEVNKIVRTDASGYIQAGWINTISGDNGTTAITRVYASSDGYIRTYTPTNFRTVLDVPTRTGGDASGTWGISVTGSAATLTTARTINGVSFNGSANITVADATKLPLTGGTLTGELTVNGTIENPVDNSAIVAGNNRNIGFVKKSGFTGHITTGSASDITFSKLSTTTITTANVIGGTLTTLATLSTTGNFSTTGAITANGSVSATASAAASVEGFFTNTNTGVTASAGVRAIANSTGYYALRQYGTAVTAIAFGQTLANYTLLFTDGASSNGLMLGALTADPVIFGTNNAERMRISAAGGLTVGNTTDAGVGNIAVGTGSSYGFIRGTVYLPTFGKVTGDDSVYINNANGSFINLSTNGSERMRIFSSGGVSIGNTADPGATNLSVTGTVTASNHIGAGTGLTGTAASLSIGGNAATATTLQTARTINGTSFNGSANITTANWGTARTLTIGNTGKSVDGSAGVSWSLTELGAFPWFTGGTIDVNAANATGLYQGTTDTWTNRGPFGNNAGALLNINTHPGNYFSQFWFNTAGGGFYHRTANNALPTSTWQRVFAEDYHPNADTLTTARTISGVSFDGSANITLNTSGITENTNLYYTDVRARAALSFVAGSGAYNSTTGAITIPTNTNQLTNGAGFLTTYTDTLATVTSRGATTTSSITLPAVEGYAYGFWTSTSAYSIAMGVTAATYQYGTVTDYSIKTSMGGGAGRGFTWGQNGVKPIASLNSTTGNMQIAGTFSAASKSFLIPHPTKEGKQLRYGSLEGPENGVYIRGKLKDDNTIELPEYWTKLVDPDSITVNLTPIGNHQNLYVESIADNKVVIGNGNLINKNINCFFVVYAERIDVDKLIVESE